MNLSITLLFFLCVLVTASCDANVPLKVEGEITKAFLSELDRIEDGTIVSLNSPGGEISYSILSSKIIRDRELNIIVTQYCLSGCAEFLLPVAKNLHFEEAVIGFHQSPLLLNSLKTDYPNLNLFSCYPEFEDWVSYQKRIQTDFLGKPEFWRDVKSRLGKIEFKEKRIELCDGYAGRLENQFWFPTSDQLRNLYGLKFSGSVCADDPDCYGLKILKKFSTNQYVVIGDDIYRGEEPRD